MAICSYLSPAQGTTRSLLLCLPTVSIVKLIIPPVTWSLAKKPEGFKEGLTLKVRELTHKPMPAVTHTAVNRVLLLGGYQKGTQWKRTASIFLLQAWERVLVACSDTAKEFSVLIQLSASWNHSWGYHHSNSFQQFQNCQLSPHTQWNFQMSYQETLDM